MIWVQLPVDFILSEETVFWVEDLVAKFGDELFEEATSVYSFFSLAMLINKLDLKGSMHVNLVHKYLVVSVLQDESTVDCDWVESIVGVSLLLDQVLEDLRPQSEWNGMWHIDKNSMAYSTC